MKLGVYSFVASVTLLASTANALCDLSACKSFSFRCGWDIYQGGMELGHPTMTDGLVDSCDMGDGKYRPMTEGHYEIMKSKLLAANSTTIGNVAKKLKCRGYDKGNPNKGWGKRLNSFACYTENGDSYLWKFSKKNKEAINDVKECALSKQYFTSHDPKLKPWSSCDPESEDFECQPGTVCAHNSNGKYKCLPDPMRDHECCISKGENTPCEVGKGQCCAGATCIEGKCKGGWEPKTVTEFPGICTNHTVRKTGILQGNMCLLTSDKVTPSTPNKKQQGDCALGLYCSGKNGYGFCKWWNKYKDKCNIKRWKKGCRTGDCQEGTYCHYKYRSNGKLKFTQCRPKPYDFQGKEGDDVHDGLCSNPKKKRVYKKKLGKCIGAVASVWGDPHVISYDNLKWNCMAQGDYIITDNWLIKAQGRFDGMPNKGYKVSQSKAFAVQTGQHTPDDESDDALFQIFFPEDYVHLEDKEDFDHDIYKRGYLTDCPVAIRYNDGYIHLTLDENGVVEKGQVFINDEAVTAEVTRVQGGNKGVYLVLDFKTGVSVEFRIHGGGSSQWNGCVMSIKICLPDNEKDIPYPDTVGLLGFPDGKKSNDWMRRKNETHVTFMEAVINGPGKNQKQWEYCTTHWCIRDMEDSIMPYSDDGVEGAGATANLLNSQHYFDLCDQPFPGDLNLDFCKTKEPCKKHLPEGMTYDDMVAEGMNFPATFEMCCIECMFGQEACEEEEHVVDDIETTEEEGVEADPFEPVTEVVCSNLGPMLSGTSGPGKYEGPQPPPICGDDEAVCVGQDDSYGVFVGGHLTVKMAENLEGRVHAGAGITIENPVVVDTSDEKDEEGESDGEEIQLNGIGWATCGSHMCPSEMSRVLEVCGSIDISMPEEEKVEIMPLDDMMGTVVYTSTYKENGVLKDLLAEGEVAALFDTKGDVKKVETSEVCSIANDLLTPLKAKSSYWASDEYIAKPLPVTGKVHVVEDHGIMVLKKPAYEQGCPLIFNMDASMFDREEAPNGEKWKILFDSSIGEHQTVIINVLGETVNFKNIQKMQEEVSCLDPDHDCWPSEGYAFSELLVSNLLWNFPDATSIQFGESPDICPFTFHGSVLAPKADVVWHYSTHRGRFIVGGDMTINRHDATFMNYAFDPVGCKLPQPDDATCVDVLDEDEDKCVTDYLETAKGSNVCPVQTESIVNMVGDIGWPASTDEYNYMDGTGIIYGMVMDEEKKSIKFNVNTAMKGEADIYVKHEVFADGSSWLEPICEMVPKQDHCLKNSYLETDARQFEVACQTHTADDGSTSHYAVAYIYFATKDKSVVEWQAANGGGATIDKCCYPTDYALAEETYAIVEYSYMISCECPDDPSAEIATRKLRG